MCPEFIETVTRLIPFYWIRAVGGTLFLLSACLGGYNLVMTWMARPKKYEVPVHEAPALSKEYDDGPPAVSRLTSNAGIGHAGDRFLQGHWHRRWERLPVRFTVWVVVAVGVASLFEIIPTFLIRSNETTISTVLPYTPLEVAGRDIYIAEGCYNCHSQMIRPIYSETQRYGEYTKPGETVYDRPFQWGSRRIGPDLAREGVTNPNSAWHYQHFENPQVFTEGSIMPSYKHLLKGELDFGAIQPRIRALAMVGTPYGEAVKSAEPMARSQAKRIADDIRTQMPGVELPEDLENRKVIALIAYIQRLGTDIQATPEQIELRKSEGAGQ